MGEPLRIILDTDLAMGAPGSDIDDGFALALALALADPGLEVEVVTTVGGNSDVVTSTRLTRERISALGRCCSLRENAMLSKTDMCGYSA